MVKESLSPSQIASGSLSGSQVETLDAATVMTIDVPSHTWEPSACNTIKHIPKSARPSCANHLAEILRRAANQPEVEDNWWSLMNWPAAILQLPKRGGKRRNVTNNIKSRIAGSTSATQPVVESKASPKKSMGAAISLAQAVCAKLEEGNIRAALRLLSSDDTIAAQSDETLASLRSKHPPASQPVPNLINIQVENLTVDQNAVQKAVTSFPPGSAGGPDGLRPQQLKELVQCREAGAHLLAALTDFVNMILAGRCPVAIASVFFGGRLIALSKKSGGIRPIAVGMTLRRLVSKCASTYGSEQLTSYLRPRQLGVGTPGGCEAAVHAARRYLQAMTDDHAVVKLDFSNAFNSLHRSDMLQAVKDRLPALLNYCYSSYVRPSKLFYGPHVVWSQEGPQQGDPLGPLLFSNTLQPLLLSCHQS